MRNALRLLILSSILLAACASGPTLPPITPGVEPGPTDPSTESPISTKATQTEEPGANSQVMINKRVDDPRTYLIHQLISRDGILPIYEPEFVPADRSSLIEDELIIGVAWEGQAKAYPITVLRAREMVNDELAGIPTLVTW